MTLGERIAAQRAAHRLSQSDLAEQLEVSRQSVSKWETDTSVPELDKLTKMCEIFGLTMDQLVRGIEPEQAPAAPETANETPGKTGVTIRQIVGVTLLGFSGLVFLLIVLLSGQPLGAFVGAAPLLVLGVLWLVFSRPGLPCGWTLWIMIMVYLRCATGIRPWWIFIPELYRDGMELHALIGWGEVLSMIILIAVTGWRLRKRKE